MRIICFPVDAERDIFVSLCIEQYGAFITDRLSALSRRIFEVQTSDKPEVLYNTFAYKVPSLFQGDSGGPLQVRAHSSSMCDFDVVGIVSFGLGCALPNTPALFTRVSKYVPWIESVVCSYKDES
jgi:secreted trypsin-like serine protease